MADQPTGPLVEAVRKLGSVAGKIVKVVAGAEAPPAAAAPARAPKKNEWQSEYVGSGTFIIHKPRRKSRKRRQQALHSPKPGMRK